MLDRSSRPELENAQQGRDEQPPYSLHSPRANTCRSVRARLVAT